MSRIRAISRPVKVTVLAKSLRNVNTPSATKISRSCSVGKPSSLLPCTCQVTRAVEPSGRVLEPLISIFPTRFPTRRSKTANGIAARFSSSTERFMSEGLGKGFPLTTLQFAILLHELYNEDGVFCHLFIIKHIVMAGFMIKPTRNTTFPHQNQSLSNQK